MKPIIVNSYPINGSENISLDSNIVITFGAEIQKPLKENILIQNLNKNELCNFELSLSDDSKTLTLIVSDPNAIGSNKLCGLTKYSIELNGIRGTTPEKVNLFLSFYLIICLYKKLIIIVKYYSFHLFIYLKSYLLFIYYLFLTFISF